MNTFYFLKIFSGIDNIQKIIRYLIFGGIDNIQKIIRYIFFCFLNTENEPRQWAIKLSGGGLNDDVTQKR